jgi:hypothetical protein
LVITYHQIYQTIYIYKGFCLIILNSGDPVFKKWGCRAAKPPALRVYDIVAPNKSTKRLAVAVLY